MGVWVRIVKGILTDPLATFGEVADQRTWREGIVFYWLVGLSVWAIGLLRAKPQGALSERVDQISSSPWFSLLLSLAGPLFILFSAAILYWAARPQGGTGPFKRLFTTELFNGAAVSLVSTPLLLVIYLITRVSGNGSFLLYIESLITGICSIVLTYFSVRVSMGLSKRGAINTLLMMIGTVSAISIMLACLGALLFLGTRR